MAAKPKVRVFRMGSEVDPLSTKIRPDQAERLKRIKKPDKRIVRPEDPLKLVSKDPEPVYTLNKQIRCSGGCGRISPTKRMYTYTNSSRGKVHICENCVDRVEANSFINLDALDQVRKKPKID